MTYALTVEADNDLVEMYLHGFFEFGEEQAEKYFSEIEHCFQLLSEDPLLCREHSIFSPPVRIHHHGRHLILYIVRNDDILIIRVLHERMDIQKQLNNL